VDDFMDVELKYFLAALLFLMFLPTLSSALICSGCKLGNCSCSITECSSGVFDAYTSSDCSGVPVAESFFKGGKISWKPMETTTYYVMSFCDDRITKSSCTPLTIAGEKTPTTTTTEEYEIVELNPFLVGVLVVAAIVIIGTIIIVVYSYT
jgi:hypothetical protein